ncbi:hypothetical protein X741_32115 [Mesorhizobium sp. LNHC229A00]|nr:hypothetical protein X741_32115 [Mesorhizobium sp. LNHC229A00]
MRVDKCPDRPSDNVILAALLFRHEFENPAGRDDLIVINERQSIEIRIGGKLESGVTRENNTQTRLDEMVNLDAGTVCRKTFSCLPQDFAIAILNKNYCQLKVRVGVEASN